jgi:hypothetical protein
MLLTRTIPLLSLVLGFTGLPATSALGASQTATTYKGTWLCVKGTATQYPSAIGLASRWATASAEPYAGDCSTPLPLSPGKVRAKAEVYKWTAFSMTYCTGTPWKYGGYRPGHRDGDLYIPPTYGVVTSSFAGTCGPGYYAVRSAAEVYYDDGTAHPWKGGWLWSGLEHIW